MLPEILIKAGYYYSGTNINDIVYTNGKFMFDGIEYINSINEFSLTDYKNSSVSFIRNYLNEKEEVTKKY